MTTILDRKKEIITKTIEHLRAQKKFSYEIRDGEFTCVYRRADGARCAAGFWIPDNVYKPFVEGLGFHSLKSIHDKIGLSDYDIAIIDRLQEIHDAHARDHHDSDEPGDEAFAVGECIVEMQTYSQGVSQS